MADASIPASTTGVARPAPAAASPGSDAAKADPKAKSFWPSFHEVLSALNPLQYVPVVGTLYRSLTGDTIPDRTRMAGSLVFSGLASGPIGVATSLAADFLERATGIDPERIGHNILASLGIGERLGDAASAPKDAARLAEASPGAPTAPQLAAYGVRRPEDGDAREASSADALSEADALNAIELARLRAGPHGGAALAAAAYGRAAMV